MLRTNSKMFENSLMTAILISNRSTCPHTNPSTTKVQLPHPHANSSATSIYFNFISKYTI